MRDVGAEVESAPWGPIAHVADLLVVGATVLVALYRSATTTPYLAARTDVRWPVVRRLVAPLAHRTLADVAGGRVSVRDAFLKAPVVGVVDRDERTKIIVRWAVALPEWFAADELPDAGWRVVVD